MNLTHQKYIQLRDLILKSEKETNGPKIFKMNDMYIHEECGGNLNSSIQKKLNEVSLDKVLMALGKNGVVTMSVPMLNGLIQFERGNLHSETHEKIFFPWTLGKPLHEQSEDTWDQLIKILL